MEIKREILNAIIQKLEETLDLTIEQSNMAKDASINTPGRNESSYDSSKEEMAHLANSFSKKALKIENEIKKLRNFSILENKEKVTLGSLVEININNNDQFVFLTPCSGGQKIEVGDMRIFTINKEAPISSVIFGKKIGETARFNGKLITIKNIE